MIEKMELVKGLGIEMEIGEVNKRRIKSLENKMFEIGINSNEFNEIDDYYKENVGEVMPEDVQSAMNYLAKNNF